MKLFAIGLLTFTCTATFATEFERRTAINEEQSRERARINQERALAERNASAFEAIAASLCLPPSAV